MPAPTLVPDDEKQDEKYNAAKQDYERRFNENTPSQGYVEKGLRDLENFANQGNSSSSTSVREQEGNGSTPASTFRSTYTGARKSGKKKLTRVQFWRRTGIIGGAGGIIGIVIFFLAGFIPLGGVLLNLSEVATANRDSQNTILTKRLYRVIDVKISQDVAPGCANNFTKVACRFSRPSNALLSRLADNGIQPVDKAGTPIKKTLAGFPNEKPAAYMFNGTSVEAKAFVSTLQGNPEFRKAFTSAYNMRYWGYADNFIKTMFYKKYGVDRSGKATISVDAEDPQKSIKALANGSEKGNTVKSAPTETEKNAAATQLLTEEITEEVEKSATKVWKTGGDPVIAVGVAACLGINTPGVITKIARAYQMRQEIVLASALVLTASSMLKAGDIDPETMTTIGTLLTATTLMPDGTQSKSAMDSDGIKSILFNNAPKHTDSFTKYIPGYGAIKTTSGISAFASSPAMKTTCDTIYSPEAQITATAIEAGIGAATAGTGAVVLAALKAVGKGVTTVVAVSTVMEALSPVIADGVSWIAGQIGPEAIAQVLGNEDISNATGEGLGNVLAGGMSFFYSNATLSTGGGALTTNQLTAYSEASQEVMVAYAEQDRFGRSPLDVSSPYTFLGSIVSNYYNYAYVPNNVLQTVASSIGYTLSRPFSLLSPSTYAAADNLSERCSYAGAFNVDESVAIGAFGDICAGIPAEYLNTSPTDVLNFVSDEIDEDSGTPKEDSDIQSALDACGDGDLLAAMSCTITTQERANKSIYMYDLRINNLLDGTNTDEPSVSLNNRSSWFAVG